MYLKFRTLLRLKYARKVEKLFFSSLRYKRYQNIVHRDLKGMLNFILTDYLRNRLCNSDKFVHSVYEQIINTY